MVEAIERSVSEVTGVPQQLINSRLRRADVAQARAIRTYLATQLTNIPLTKLGKRWGLHHSTLIHHRNQIRREYGVYHDTAELVNQAKLEAYKQLL